MSGPRREAWLLGGVAVLGVLAWLAVARTSPSAESFRRSGEFQRLVGGLGSGGAFQLGECGRAFDCRLRPTCAAALGPIAGGDRFCTRHPNWVFQLHSPAASEP